MDNLIAIAGQFLPQGRVFDIREYGNGNINNTYLVTSDSAKYNYFILQGINTQVFRDPGSVMMNMRLISGHVLKRLQQTPPVSGRRWELPHVLLTHDGRDHWITTDGSFWRAISFIDKAQSFDVIQDARHAGEVGYALGTFQNLLSDLSPETLADTLPGFHVTPLYLRHFKKVISTHGAGTSTEEKYCLQFVGGRTEWAHVLENAREEGRLNLRPIHGDPKINNIMMDKVTGQAVSIVDLDTVKPGLVHYDIGDCLRSCCNLLGEETQEWESVRFEPDLCKAVLRGYLNIANSFLTDNDYEYIYDAICLLAFELGVRFFTDHLEGNIYFKANYQEHNLARALVQFKLAESIESFEPDIRAIIKDMI